MSYLESSGSLASGWSPGDQPLDKEPEDSGYEIDLRTDFQVQQQQETYYTNNS